MSPHRDTINAHNAWFEEKKIAYIAIGKPGRVTEENAEKMMLDDDERHYSVEVSDAAGETYYAEYIVSINDKREASFAAVFGTENAEAGNVAINAALDMWERGE